MNVARALSNLFYLVAGAVCLSLYGGWELGVGVACLTVFHKAPE